MEGMQACCFWYRASDTGVWGRSPSRKRDVNVSPEEPFAASASKPAVREFRGSKQGQTKGQYLYRWSSLRALPLGKALPAREFSRHVVANKHRANGAASEVPRPLLFPGEKRKQGPDH
jgi:hypothetical protein